MNFSMMTGSESMYLIMGILITLPFWIIFPKAGYSKWLSLLMVIPMVNLVVLYVLAFSDWPNRDETTQLPNSN